MSAVGAAAICVGQSECSMAGKLNDMTGRKFGRLTVIRRAENDQRPNRWLCRCVCGCEKTIRAKDLRSGNTSSCGCWRREVHRSCGRRGPELLGARFGRLVVVERAGKNAHGALRWRCQCDCGGETCVETSTLHRGAAGVLALQQEDRRGSCRASLWSADRLESRARTRQATLVLSLRLRQGARHGSGESEKWEYPVVWMPFRRSD